MNSCYLETFRGLDAFRSYVKIRECATQNPYKYASTWLISLSNSQWTPKAKIVNGLNCDNEIKTWGRDVKYRIKKKIIIKVMCLKVNYSWIKK